MRNIEFARQFGELTPGHAVYGSDSEYPEIYPISKTAALTIFANRFVNVPGLVGIVILLLRSILQWRPSLRGDIVPPYGGDTQFTNLMAAYNALSPVMQTFVNGLRGVFRNGMAGGANVSKEYAEQIKNRTLETEHPLVRVHPETGERALYVAPTHLKDVVGLTPTESLGVLEMLWGASCAS